MLFNGVNKLLSGVPHELQIDLANFLSLFDPSLNCKEPGLVELLRFDQLLHPVFLTLLESLDKVLLVDEVLLILAEILRTDVLDFVKFLVIFLR